MNCARNLDESIPSLAAGINDLIVTVETAVSQVAVTQVLPYLFGGIEFGRSSWQRQQRQIVCSTYNTAE
jgi:hypothetical protein